MHESEKQSGPSQPHEFNELKTLEYVQGIGVHFLFYVSQF